MMDAWHLFLLGIYPLLMLRVFSFQILRSLKRQQKMMRDLEAKGRREMQEMIDEMASADFENEND